MTKSTPGPWFAKGGKVLVQMPGGLEQVAECWRHPEGGFLCPDMAEAEANARLLAAAPDLLAALRQCETRLAQMVAKHDASTHPALDAARAAIAKAEG